MYCHAECFGIWEFERLLFSAYPWPREFTLWAANPGESGMTPRPSPRRLDSSRASRRMPNQVVEDDHARGLLVKGEILNHRSKELVARSQIAIARSELLMTQSDSADRLRPKGK